MARVETRTATFLLTDIEGSSRLWQDHRDQMAGSLKIHDELLRGAIEEAGGSVVKGTGDGMLASFDRPEAAITAAVAAQRALLRAEWPPRMRISVRTAVHAGGVEVRDGDVFGPALNRLARLMGIGHGGQILVSGAAAALVGDALPDDVEVIDRGEHRLRDLDRPEHVFQVVAPGLPRDFPPLRSAALRTNLPTDVTTFIGREREVGQVRSLIGEHRLVTLVGVGGTGKTRLMLRVAEGLGEEYEDGRWLVELAPIHDPALIVPEIARALAIPDAPGQQALAVVTDYLRDKHLLLLLDNCEHLIEGVADVVQRLLAACRSVAAVTTSREALGIAGEAIFQVPSLGLPRDTTLEPGSRHMAGSGDDTAGDEEAAASEAVRLFVDRARAVAPDLRFDVATLNAVAEICRRLDGIPLAIELAAARVKVLSVEEIADRVEDRFRLLTGGRRTTLPRQQTLQALIDWSWDLLTPSDQAVLRRLSVFAGGWTLESAAEVVSDVASDLDAAGIEVLDGLARLADRSLINVERTGATRYRMLETIRQYAGDRLLDSGEASAIRSRHLRLFRQVALDAARHLEAPDLLAWLDRLDAEAENLRSALTWAHETDLLAAVEMSVALARYWRHRSIGPEGVDRLRQAVASIDRLPSAPPGDAARRDALIACLEAAEAESIELMGGDNAEAMRLAEDAVRLARRSGDRMALSWAYLAHGVSSAFSGAKLGAEFEKLSLARLQEAEHVGAWTSAAYMASGMAQGLVLRDPEVARSLAARSIESARTSGNPDAIAFTEMGSGRVEGLLGDFDAARALFQRAIADYGALRDRRMQLIARSDLAHTLRRAGGLAEAEAESRLTIVEWQSLGNRGAIANQLEAFAFMAAMSGDPERSATLLGAAERLRELGHAGMLPHEQAEYAQEVGRVRSALGEAELARAWAAGRAMSTEEAVALALSLAATATALPEAPA